ncbi:MAG: LPS assembly lipoprotein LptE [Gammaproteobacteria bacterium]
MGWRGFLLAFVCLSIVALPGCGFRLRGSAELPATIDTLSIQAGNPYSELVANLRRALQSGGLSIVDDPKEADAVLRIRGESTGRRVQSISAGGKVREYELQYTVSFNATDREGRETVAPQTITLTRDYIFDETAVLGTGEEEALLYRDMRQQAVAQILRRLQAGYASSGPQ